MNSLKKILGKLFARDLGSSNDGRQSILTNVTWLAAGNILVKPLWFVLLLLTARLLGAAEFGQFMLAISFASVASVVLEGGIDVLTIRELSISPAEFDSFFGHTSIYKVLSGIVSGIGAIIVAFILRMGNEIIVLVCMAALYSISNALLLHFRSVFRAFEILKYEAVSMIIEKSSVIFLCGGILLLHFGVRAYMLGYVVAYCLTSVLTFVLVLKRIAIPRWKFDFRYFWDRILRPALPFAILSLFTIIYFRSGTLMLGILTGKEEYVGYYNAGYRLVESFMLFPTIIVAPIYPVISRNREDTEKVKRVLSEASRVLLLIGTAVAFPIFIFRNETTLLLFGQGYKLAIPSVGVLAFTMIPISMNFVAGTVVAALGRQTKSNIFVLVVTLVNVVLNYILIKQMAAYGAAVTTVITETLLAICNLIIVGDYISWPRLLNLFAKSLLPAACAWAVLQTPVHHLEFSIRLAITLFVMVGGYFLVKLVTVNDVRRLLRIAG